MFILSIIRYLETIITIFEIIVLILLVDIIVLVLLFKKRNQLSKTTKNALISKKKDKLSKIKIITNSKKDNNIETIS
jgi:hypothetical protein